MKISYISDLHIDFWIKSLNPQDTRFINQLDCFIRMLNPIRYNETSVLIIAGDIGHYFKQDTAVLLSLKKYYDYIIVVPGNHDYYLISNNLEKKYKNNSFNRQSEFKEWCANNSIIYLDGNVVEIDTVKFGGLGMWHDSSYGINNFNMTPYEIKELWKAKLNDSNYIMKGSKPYKISYGYGGYDKITDFNYMDKFNEEYGKLQQINACDILVTHYPPMVPPNIKEEWAEDKCTTFYTFDGTSDIKRINPVYWIFGHMHTNYEFTVDNTTFISNPLGYPTENSYNQIKTFDCII